MKLKLIVILMSVGSLLHAEENESKVCEKLNSAAYQIMLERQSGIKSLDLLEKLMVPLDQDKENVITNYYINHFFGHVVVWLMRHLYIQQKMKNKKQLQILV